MKDTDTFMMEIREKIKTQELNRTHIIENEIFEKALSIKPIFHVYVARCNDFYKIGATGNVKHRIQTLNIGNPSRIDIKKKYEMKSMSEAYDYERTIISLLKKNGFHERGEWFKLFDIKIVDDIVSMDI